jgi:hypothetical protein
VADEPFSISHGRHTRVLALPEAAVRIPRLGILLPGALGKKMRLFFLGADYN